MFKKIQSILQSPFFQSLGAWFSKITDPILKVWDFITTPFRFLIAPIVGFFKPGWLTFKAKNPRAGFVLGWSGTFFRWGFNFLMFLIFGVWIGLFGFLPSTAELKNIETAQSTEIYSADSVLLGKYFIENRTTIQLKNISPHVINALIATEDKRFLEHEGIDYMSVLRAFKGVVTGNKDLGGGSTLSQQLAKNLYPRKNYYVPGLSLFINKIRENFTSVRLEKIYSKDDLLAMYLNTVPFGADRFGISVASKYFFNKKAKDLTPAEAATLVGMLKASTFYDPVRNPNNSKERRNVVLRQMVKNGHLTEKEFEELSKKPVNAKRYTREGSNDGEATYFREHLRTDVLPQMLKNYKKEDGSEYNLYTDGLKIYTTLHSVMQKYADEAVGKQMEDVQKNFIKQFKNLKKEKPWGDDKWIDEEVRKTDRWRTLKSDGASDEDALKNFEKPVKMTVFAWQKGGFERDTVMSPLDSVRYYYTMMNSGFMVMDHRNGYVRAWSGGINFKYFKYDHIKSQRQVGSTFKPIVYAAAVIDSVKPCQYFPNDRVTIKDWSPENADGRYGGYYSMAGALKKSVNVVAAQLIEKVGIQKTIDLARKMGVTSDLPREFGISLGAADISLYEMMQVYGTIANKGVRPDPVLVTKITTREGLVLFEKTENTKRIKATPRDSAMSEFNAAVMRKMMQGVLDSGGTGARFRRMYYLQGDFAGKTGTTQNQADGWFICFNPQLVTGAWVGGESQAVRFRSMSLGQGSASALPICAWFWYKMFNDKKLGKMMYEKFAMPKDTSFIRYFYCGTKISVHPDSLAKWEADSLARLDTANVGLFKSLKEDIGKLFGKEKNDGGENQNSDAAKTDKEVRKEERKEKRKEFFDNLLGKKDKNDPSKKTPEKPKNSGNDRQQR